MKILKSSIAICLFFLTSNAIAQQKTVQKAIIKTSIACDHCKACESCGGLLEKKLLHHKGIQMITLDEKEATIAVIYNSKKTDLAAIKMAISELGYDADEVKAKAAGYEKLDSCCKG